MVGKFSSGRLAALAAGTFAASGGALGAAFATNRPQFVVLTNRRLVFLAQTMMGGPAKKVVGEVPVGQFTLAEFQPGGMPVVRIAFVAAGDGVALTFGALYKSEAHGLVTALQSLAA
jgi:hypothetical protein